MKTVQAAEAKAKFSALLSDVERGEAINITRHGKTVARLVPPVADSESDAGDAVDRLKAWRKTLPPTKLTIDDILSARDQGRR